MTRSRIIMALGTVGALALLVGVIWQFAAQTRASSGKEVREESMASDEHSNLNRPLPEFNLITIDNQVVSDKELRRNRVLLVYLTSTCLPCIEEAKITSRLALEFHSSIRIYGIGIERSAQLARFVDKVRLSFPMLIDVDGQLARSLNINRFPSKYLIEDGVITRIWVGKTKNEEELRQQLSSVY